MLIDVTELYGIVGNIDNEIKNYMDKLEFFTDERKYMFSIWKKFWGKTYRVYKDDM